MKNNELRRWLTGIAFSTAIIVGGCGDGQVDETVAEPTPETPTVTVASLSMLAQPSTVSTDGASRTTVTVTALDANRTAISGASISLSADTGIVTTPSGTPTITTESGKATFEFTAGGTDKSNRTATITAKAGNVVALFPIQIIGSSITVDAESTVLTVGGQGTPLTVTAKDSSGNPVQNADVSITSSGSGSVTLSSSSGRTGSDGKLTITVTAASAGTATLQFSALGASASKTVNIATPVAAFGISRATVGAISTDNPTTIGMSFADRLTVTVAAPSTGAQRSVRFVTSMGQWDNGAQVQTVTATGGVASATLTTNQAGVATVQVDDPNLTTDTDSMTVGMTAVTPFKITLQATPTAIAKRVGNTAGSAEIIATVLDATNNPVGNQPVVFSLRNTTGGGESLTSVTGVSAATTTSGLSLGQVRTSMTAGSISSAQSGVLVHASIPGTNVETSVSPSSPDVPIVIGLTAGSITHGGSTVIESIMDNTAYRYARSVQVSDSNGNPVSGAVVTLSLWPIGFSTGNNCTTDDERWADAFGDTSGADKDYFDLRAANGQYYSTVDTSGNPIPGAVKTLGSFAGEDTNENLILDPGEAANDDAFLWPNNSTAGEVPATVTTDANGVAQFHHIYLKSNAIWTAVRLRAKAVVQGTETMSKVEYWLSPSRTDVSPCVLDNSPYVVYPTNTFKPLQFQR